MKFFSLLFSVIFFISTNVLFAQVDSLEISYDLNSKKLLFNKLPKKLKNNKEYALKLTQINSAHVGVVSKLSTYEYVSDIPDILKPIFLGISNNNVMSGLGTDTIAISYNTKLFLKAMIHYDKLQKIRFYGKEYYDKTKFNPKPNDTSSLNNLIRELKLKNVKEIEYQLIMSEQFILSAIESYKHNFENIDISKPILEIIHTEYATLVNIKNRIDKGEFRKSLGFLINSQKAKKHINIKTFKASKDLASFNLQVVNTYTSDTIFNGDINFKTYDSFTFDFTTGFFYSNITESKYYLDNRDDEFNNVLMEDIPDVDISIGALGHLSYKFSPSFMAGVSIGASLSPFDGKLRYLTGASLLFGKQKYLGLNVGVAFSKIKVLSDGIMKDDVGYFLPIDVTNINTVEHIETGFYIGLTYNFINKKIEK